MSETLISAAELDGAQYFSALLRGMGDADAADTRAQLQALLHRRTQRYTMGDSSSVRAETAQALLRSVCWCIGIQLQRTGAGADRLASEPLEALFAAGQQTISGETARGKALLRTLQASPPSISTRAYRDTVDALPAFFRQYDPAFFADEVPGAMIDYPLCIPVPETGGVFYVNAYMRRLLTENEFCRALGAAGLARALGRGFDDQFINLFETAFALALGRALLGADVRVLEICASDRALLLRRLGGLSAAALAQRVARAADDIAEALGAMDETAGYMRAAGLQMVPRLLAQLKTGDLAGVFAFDEPQRTAAAGPVFADGAPMPDEALRAMIDELRSCRYIEDKIAMVLRHVRSVRDMAEIVSAGFLGEQRPALFAALDEASLLALAMYTKTHGGAEWAQALAQARRGGNKNGMLL